MVSYHSSVNSRPLPDTECYTWRRYRCAYEVWQSNSATDSPPLVLLHPIGVGLSRRFWHRFCMTWLQSGHHHPIYSPDLLGCGESAMPHVAYHPIDWAMQLQYFLQTVVQRPAILVVQGALLPVAIALTQLQTTPNLVKALVLSGPPAWAVMTQATSASQQKLSWNLFDSLLGQGFYRYARRQQFLQSFSAKQLFTDPAHIDAEWLDMLVAGSQDPASRHAVFSFLAGFWRQNYEQAIAQMTQPTLVVIGDQASSISRSGLSETPDQRMADYLKHLPKGDGIKMIGRNVMPYEETQPFVEAIAPFIDAL